MTLDPRARRLLDMLAVSASTPRDTGARRTGFAALMAMAARSVAVGLVEDLGVEGGAGSLPVRLYDAMPERIAAAPCVVFFHGGGLVAGSIDTHDGICRRLANASRCRVISVGYRLAPEAKFPAALDDAVAAVRQIGARARDFGIDAKRLAVAGDSAGALLAALACAGLRDKGPPVALQVLLCPVIDLAGVWPSRQKYGEGYLIDAATVARDIADCLPEGGLAADIASPLRLAGLHGMPPAIIHTADYDPFHDEGQAYGAALAAAGVAVQAESHAGMVHSFYGLNALLPQADAALAAIGQQIARALG